MSQHSHGDQESEEELEAQHFAHVIQTFRQYETYHLSANNRRRKDFFRLSLSNQEILNALGWRTRLEKLDEKISENAIFLNSVVDHPDIFAMEQDALEDSGSNGNGHTHGHGLGHSQSQEHDHHSGSIVHPHDQEQRRKKKDKPTDFDMDKLRSTLKQFVRDWSIEGKPERDACYSPMLEALLDQFSDVPEDERGSIRVLIPGAGLARLAWEVARIGYSSQGNEFSHFMLLPSYFILNRTEQINQYTIYPSVHTLSNVTTLDHAIEPIRIPDISPSDLPPSSDFSLVAGDFVEIYGVTDADERQNPNKVSQEGSWNAILTCFFIDTAKDIVEYLKIFHRILAPGGVWINLGPLLWHWENNPTGDLSIELTLEEVKRLAEKIGFKLSDERTIPTTYTGSRNAMLRYEYQAEFWVATKT